MPVARAFSEIRLVNGSTGDPALYIDYPGLDNALLFDAGENGNLDLKRLADLEAVFLTHHHIDHFIGFDRILRANLDKDKELRIFGPGGTITRIYQRLKSYDFQYFSFMKIALNVVELEPGVRRQARMECAKKFPEPVISEDAWTERTIYENPYLTIEAVSVEHTTPCLAYALVEKPGYHPDPDKLAVSPLRPGSWVPLVLDQLRSGSPMETLVNVEGGQFSLGRLAEMGFSGSPGSRVTFVTDTIWNDSTKAALLPLAKNSWRLYCDSYYAIGQLKNAVTHKHMTATHAAEFAKLAKVDQLILMHFAPRYAGRYGHLVDEAKAIFPRTTADLGETA
ncbi:MBL fold metallo-hydrolase [Tuwongella immobilis]|uniref:Metallo-beta-lactamase domain-containing protein n=1 Tax=Tuwongella immobilis TaxID=692036 RepID=A0A6C2YJQ5_9BACT|nr:MBL fold metallo-hydrolase [Tuwongella immobilis]VIP01343.1 Beta-lactamase domain protein OS=Planctomyces limnophilus (strain ATCC 43296 / DSM 3776 / IFAM 1008 / 290) GN=Plim_3675 PE=4 SV=1: Lactamase_B_2 [Tuwongella immobilis]VTR98122.1 Beta-lactamase domain protein OS=Planctomyces limnophilus (strain ATCC 43296 / DSM 3776 / IFAM 1008 / 290) GN=Plim_3675 PE=4 SV=1: Lactamase_B_2 [Tuwongella immobilis]